MQPDEGITIGSGWLDMLDPVASSPGPRMLELEPASGASGSSWPTGGPTHAFEARDPATGIAPALPATAPAGEAPVRSAPVRHGRLEAAGGGLAFAGLVLAGTALLLPAVTWTGWQAGTRPIVGYLVGGPTGEVPPSAIPDVFTLVPAAISVGVALLARATDRRLLAAAAACVASALAAVWAWDVATTTESFETVDALILTFWSDYGTVTIHPWIWCLPAALAAFADGIALWAVASIARGLHPTAPRPPRASSWHGPRGGDPLVLLGLGLWVVAQVLPAYSRPPLLGPDANTTMGWQATLGAWDLAFLGGSWAILIAWTANIWFLIAVVSLWRRHPSLALVSASAAAACSTTGMWVLLRGGLPESSWPNAVISEIGIGSWAWFASTVVTVLGVARSRSTLRLHVRHGGRNPLAGLLCLALVGGCAADGSAPATSGPEERSMGSSGPVNMSVTVPGDGRVPVAGGTTAARSG